MTLKAQVLNFVLENPGTRFTNADIAHALGARSPSVRRATLQLMDIGALEDSGPAHYNPSVVTYVAPEV